MADRAPSSGAMHEEPKMPVPRFNSRPGTISKQDTQNQWKHSENFKPPRTDTSNSGSITRHRDIFQKEKRNLIKNDGHDEAYGFPEVPHDSIFRTSTSKSTDMDAGQHCPEIIMSNTKATTFSDVSLHESSSHNSIQQHRSASDDVPLLGEIIQISDKLTQAHSQHDQATSQGCFSQQSRYKSGDATNNIKDLKGDTGLNFLPKKFKEKHQILPSIWGPVMQEDVTVYVTQPLPPQGIDGAVYHFQDTLQTLGQDGTENQQTTIHRELSPYEQSLGPSHKSHKDQDLCIPSKIIDNSTTISRVRNDLNGPTMAESTTCCIANTPLTMSPMDPEKKIEFFKDIIPGKDSKEGEDKEEEESNN